MTPAAKSFVAGISPPGRLKRDVVISAPGKSGGGEQASEVAAEGKKQRHQALCLTPRLLHRRGAMSAGYGATGRRIRLRMLQAGFYASDRSVSPKPPLAGSVEPGWCASRRQLTISQGDSLFWQQGGTQYALNTYRRGSSCSRCTVLSGSYFYSSLFIFTKTFTFPEGYR
ncbi:hypothetical protein D0W10_24370 [Salmonella enterica]|nr:hypothetical protein [Salmonella enterica]